MVFLPDLKSIPAQPWHWMDPLIRDSFFPSMLLRSSGHLRTLSAVPRMSSHKHGHSPQPQLSSQWCYYIKGWTQLPLQRGCQPCSRAYQTFSIRGRIKMLNHCEKLTFESHNDLNPFSEEFLNTSEE